MTVRLLLWSLADSKSTLDELRAKLPELPEGDHWISDPAGERFGLITHHDADDALRQARDLIGRDPDVGDEFDIEYP